MKKQGGSMIAVLFFALGFICFIAGAVLYLVKDDSTSKKWSEYTKGVVTSNEKLLEVNRNLAESHKAFVKESGEAIKDLYERVSAQGNKIDKVEFLVLAPPKALAMPQTVNFRVLKTQVISAQAQPNVKANGATDLTKAQKNKLMKKVKKQVRELSQ